MKKIFAIILTFISLFLFSQSCSAPPMPPAGEKLVEISESDVAFVIAWSMPWKDGLIDVEASASETNHGRNIFDREKIRRICDAANGVYVEETEELHLDGDVYNLDFIMNDGSKIGFLLSDGFINYFGDGLTGDDVLKYTLTSSDSYDEIISALDFDNPIISDVPTTRPINLSLDDYLKVSYQSGYTGFRADLSSEEAQAVIDKLNSYEAAYIAETAPTVGYTDMFLFYLNEEESFSVIIENSGAILLPKYIVDSAETDKSISTWLYSPDEDYFNRNWEDGEPLKPKE